MKTLILGLGISGRAVARYLGSCTALDAKGEKLAQDPEVKGLIERGLKLVLELSSLDGFDQVVLSPGFPPKHPLLQNAKIPIVGEAGFALERLSNRMVAVTGSNGKTTTVLMIEHVLNHCGIKARAVGNVGKPLTDLLIDPHPAEVLVVELSSFQLETLRSRVFEAAVVLNITENHLDRYDSFLHYAKTKAHLEALVKEGGTFYISQSSLQTFSSLFSNPQIFGETNRDAAFCLCSNFGITNLTFEKALETFRSPPHRIEWVAEINGVKYYNDSKATSVAAVVHAVEKFSEPLILLVGGVDKGASYAPWREKFFGKVKAVFGFGPAAVLMEKELKDLFSFTLFSTMQQAVDAAKREAKCGDVVLLSPGGSSYDQFTSYVHRGEEFVKKVMADG